MDTILNHRTIRKYSSKEINDTLLNKILNAGTRASTTGNMQVYSIIVTRDENKKAELAPCHFNQPMIKQAPVVLTLCADYNRFNLWCKENNAEPGYDNFLSFFNGVIDSMLVAQNISIAAEDEGLGICYLGTTIYTAKKIIEILELPKGVVPITTITLGYPDESPKLTDRLPLEAVVHNETYKNYTGEDINNLYREKENLEENINFVKENNKETLAQIFTDIRYKKGDNETFSKAFLEVIKEQGFLD